MRGVLTNSVRQVRARTKKSYIFQSLLLLCLLLSSCSTENYQKDIDSALSDGDACYALLNLSIAIGEQNKEFSPALVRSYLNRISDLGEVVGNTGFQTDILNLSKTLLSVNDFLWWRINTLEQKYCYDRQANTPSPSPSKEFDGENSQEIPKTKGTYTVTKREAEAAWGNYCQTAPGIGWLCIAEVTVRNISSGPISPKLTAQLIDTQGRIFESSDDPENKYLTGSFNLRLNPSGEGYWSIFFTTAPDVKFKTLNIFEGNVRVASIPYNCSTDAKAETC